MSDWRDSLGRVTFDDGRTLIGASFRGVPFFVESAERQGGRRTARHEYPLRDKPFIEDLGRRSRSFPLDGYVVGPGYVAQRDRLIAALEEAGPGELEHPTYGRLRVICTSFRVRESTDDGGLARFGLEFEETEATAPTPTAAPAASAAVGFDGDAYIAQMKKELAERKEVSLPLARLASISATIADASKAMQAALAPLVRGTQELASLKAALDAIVLDVDALAREPLDAAEAFLGALEAFRSPDLPPRGGALGLLAAYAFSPTTARPPATTPNRIAERELYDLTLDTIRTLLVVEAARLAVDQEYDSYDAAVAMRDAICDPIDAQMANASDAAFALLEQLRADLVRALPGEESDLPRLVRMVPAYTIPSLVLAHRLYGDVAREADLVTRNGILRPGFVPGGSELETLSHG